VNLDKILNGLKTLTPREHEVLNQVVSGQLNNKEIASELGITIRTVKEHRRRVMEKMEANSLAELVTMIVTVRLHETRMMTQATPIAVKTKPHKTTLASSNFSPA
jgi:DNA-binding CsgD family transcriptional regulator